MKASKQEKFVKLTEGPKVIVNMVSNEWNARANHSVKSNVHNSYHGGATSLYKTMKTQKDLTKKYNKVTTAKIKL